ncbi:hypothetical protein [Rhodopseudomonas palustris]|uniref:hypothetical protein n=1 Tax=Rhodopseudomonas palustris TaxID=1076 RepID=UPI0021F301D5|nr:hypothetical protein [Rhodopseudomonas palustris]UYO54617.1 hypothetical protein KQX61_04115 [Rhodopseudomonas palustris]
MVGLLTDEELQQGGMKRVVAFVRQDRSKEAQRQARRREKMRGNKRQINVEVADDDRSRATVRATAAGIRDEICHDAIEAVLANDELRPIVVDLNQHRELREIVESCRRSATPDLVEVVKVVAEQASVRRLVRNVGGSRRKQATVEAALANPAYVRLGQILATQTGPCGLLARRILRVRKRISGDVAGD